MDINKLLINKNTTIKEALKQLDKTAKKILFVIDESNKLLGALTDGDFRRRILKTGGIEGFVDEIYTSKPVFLKENYNKNIIKEFFIENFVEAVPVINAKHEVIDIIFWQDAEKKRIKQQFKNKNTSVIIMAGGKGSRLAPFTNILPKPLIPIGNKTMIELIMEEYNQFGLSDFYISVNYKAKMIKAYFEETGKNRNIKYIEEKKPLGTIGALKQIEKQIKKPFFVSNCDVLIKTDYKKMYDFHQERGYEITIVASMQHYKVPYGVCEIENNGQLKKITEKPEFDYLVNAGMYVLNPDVLSLIPENKVFHITDLISKLQEMNKKVGVFPVSEKSWVDIGQWKEYRNAVSLMKIND